MKLPSLLQLGITATDFARVFADGIQLGVDLIAPVKDTDRYAKTSLPVQGLVPAENGSPPEDDSPQAPGGEPPTCDCGEPGWYDHDLSCPHNPWWQPPSSSALDGEPSQPLPSDAEPTDYLGLIVFLLEDIRNLLTHLESHSDR